MSILQARGFQPGMGTKYVIILAFDAGRLNVRNRCYCVCPLTLQRTRVLTQPMFIAYNSDGVYLYSTRDEPESPQDQQGSRSILAPNPKRKRVDITSSPASYDEPLTDLDVEMSDELDTLLADSVDAVDHIDDESQEDEEDEETDEDADEDNRMFNPADADAHQAVPVIYPRMRFSGHCNVETVKDGAFD